MEDKHIVWSDINLNYEDWRADLESEHPDMTENERIALMYETNSDYLSDERINLNIQLPRSIIAIADLGLWNGRFSGYKMIESGNIRDCLYSDCDYNEWYVDKLGDLRCTAVHHDGRNHYLYRVIKETATDGQVDRLQSLIYSGRATRQDITRVTERLGDAIGAVYCWSFPKQKQRTNIER
ncbi:hypothetical protein SDC9_54451 [bioreactor metagenome]|uniref:Uncharacterized protein n=1 Tax=bioreactor metagenome TaxID=1076179 RepID=A0A644WWH0_9ZZZZ